MGLYVSQPLDRLQVLEERISYLERQLQETPSSTTIIENDFEKVEKKWRDQNCCLYTAG